MSTAVVTQPQLRRGPVTLGPILYFVSVIVCCFGVAMLAPTLLDLVDGNSDYRIFLLCALGTLFVGVTVAIATRSQDTEMTVQETMLAVPAAWLTVALCSAVPLMLSQFQLSLTDAIFEVMSGLTATGSTVIVGLDEAPRGLLLWRFLLVWFGGFGVVTIAVLLLPFLRIGGLQLFSLDLSAQSGKFLPRITEVITQIGLIYIGLTALCAFSYWLAGMNVFDAIGHAMAAVATGGFSSHDASIGYFHSPAIEWISVVFMALSAMPFVLHLQALHGQPGPLVRDSQVRLFLGIIAGAVVALTLWQMVHNGAGFSTALRQASFAFVSIITCTGFTSPDYAQWGGFPELVMLLGMLAGGCTGSTAGGIKMFRLLTLVQMLRVQIRRQVFPHGTFRVTFNGETVPDLARSGVANYFFIYMSSFFLLSLGLTATGMGFIESLGSAATALGGVGPALGPNVGPCCTYQSIPDAAKWMMAIGMLAGRLEILILIIPFSRSFWRQ
ncbi:TrkH family potassium uptake protein [Ferrovibrio xuzhouensis]|uniref:Trk system potassium uptake protein n=1 Tax=Ferrovibrio xuzhouensis TaxID=1576914 RepID=A0ABV7VGZ8_9PROT